MFVLIQRVSAAQVAVNQRIIAQIQSGLLALVGFGCDDNEQTLHTCIDKLRHFRLFSDENNKMNRSLMQINGDLLLVPQFTLLADTSSGRRPSFTSAAPPEQGRALFESLCRHAQSCLPRVEQGEFGADMQVSLTNDGPVTFHFTF